MLVHLVTEINVGRDIQVATPDKDVSLFKDVTTGITLQVLRLILLAVTVVWVKFNIILTLETLVLQEVTMYLM